MPPISALSALNSPSKTDINNTIVFDTSKNEPFKINDGFREVNRVLKNQWRVASAKEITVESLAAVKIFIIAGPREKFNEAEFNALRQYLDLGGNLFVTLSEGGEIYSQTNINFILEEYGIMVNNDCVISAAYQKYFHPKECLIEINNTSQDVKRAIVYPFGATLNIARPAVAMAITCSASIPQQRPIAACYTNPRVKSGGKLVVVGSTHIFCDSYIDKESNRKFFESIIDYINDKVSVPNEDVDHDIAEYSTIPDIMTLSQSPRVCLTESEEIPPDWTSLYNNKLYSLDSSLLPKVLEAYQQLGVKHEPLKLIPPQFETPLPPLQVAVFPPIFRSLAAPSLELFDLDAEFSSERLRLGQLANRCNNSDLEYFIAEAGHILNITQNMEQPLQNTNEQKSKLVLHHIFKKISNFKSAFLLGNRGDNNDGH